MEKAVRFLPTGAGRGSGIETGWGEQVRPQIQSKVCTQLYRHKALKGAWLLGAHEREAFQYKE